MSSGFGNMELRLNHCKQTGKTHINGCSVQRQSLRKNAPITSFVNINTCLFAHYGNSLILLPIPYSNTVSWLYLKYSGIKLKYKPSTIFSGCLLVTIIYFKNDQAACLPAEFPDGYPMAVMITNESILSSAVNKRNSSK